MDEARIVECDSLDGRAVIYYDSLGIPHIEAETLGGAYFAQGYAVGRARLFQLDLFRRTAAGRLAECFGSASLAGDEFQRCLGLSRLAEAKEKKLRSDVRERIQHYADGINAAANREKRPWEFEHLHIEWSPWTVHDALLCGELRAILNASWRADLVVLQTLVKLGPERASVLFLDQQMSDWTLPSVRNADSATLLAESLELLKVSEDALMLAGLQHTDIGTNTWVVGPKGSISNTPLLANDLHMGFVAPNPNFLVHMSAPGLHVRGICFPGIPGIFVGHNEQIAWGSAAFMADSQDVFIEQLNEAGTHYLYAGEWRPLESHSEILGIRGRSPKHIVTKATHHGPIVRQRGRWALSLCWERLHEPPGDPTFYGVNTASDWNSFREGLRESHTPPTDFTYADIHGNIGAQTNGRVPTRPRGDGSIPVPGDSRCDWNGSIPFDELPSVYNPNQGYLVRANQNHPGWESKHFYSRRWHPYYRASRVQELLIKGWDQRHDVESFARIQFDRYSKHGRFVADKILAASEGLPRTTGVSSIAFSTLTSWNGMLDEVSTGAALVKECASVLKEKVLIPHLGKRLFLQYQKYWPASNLAVETILDTEDRSWLPSGYETWQTLLSDVLCQAAENLERRFSGGPERWSWGELHPAKFSHPLVRDPAFPDAYKIEDVRVGSDGECVFSSRSVGDFISSQQTCMLKQHDALAAIFGASARMVLDVGNWDNCSLLLNLGQSGDPASRHYKDQLYGWRDGRTQRVAFSWKEVRESAEEIYTLLPLS